MSSRLPPSLVRAVLRPSRLLVLMIGLQLLLWVLRGSDGLLTDVFLLEIAHDSRLAEIRAGSGLEPRRVLPNLMICNTLADALGSDGMRKAQGMFDRRARLTGAIRTEGVQLTKWTSARRKTSLAGAWIRKSTRPSLQGFAAVIAAPKLSGTVTKHYLLFLLGKWIVIWTGDQMVS